MKIANKLTPEQFIVFASPHNFLLHAMPSSPHITAVKLQQLGFFSSYLMCTVFWGTGTKRVIRIDKRAQSR